MSQMLSSGGEANEGLRPAGLPHRRAPLLIVLLIPLLACLGTATAAQGRYGLRGPAPSRALAADGRRLVATAAPTSVAGGGMGTTHMRSVSETRPCSESHCGDGFYDFISRLLWPFCFIIFSHYEETTDYDDGMDIRGGSEACVISSLPSKGIFF